MEPAAVVVAPRVVDDGAVVGAGAVVEAAAVGDGTPDDGEDPACPDTVVGTRGGAAKNWRAVPITYAAMLF